MKFFLLIAALFASSADTVWASSGNGFEVSDKVYVTTCLDYQFDAGAIESLERKLHDQAVEECRGWPQKVSEPTFNCVLDADIFGTEIYAVYGLQTYKCLN